MQDFDEAYPVQSLQCNPERFDLRTYPFGCLTALGMSHLKRMGRKMKDHFAQVLGDLSSHPADKIRVYATNYQRTQLSAQAFMMGMGIPIGTPIQVRSVSDCAMSFYRGKRDLSRSLSSRIQETPKFQTLEGQVLHVAEVLQANYPSLDASTLNWIAVADHINCAVAHGHDLPAAMSEHAELLRGNAVQRFVTHYKDREFLAHFAGPLLRDVLLEIESEVESLMKGQKTSQRSHSQITIFSGHDVNILGMMFALNALVDDEHWPSYGSSLTMEGGMEAPHSLHDNHTLKPEDIFSRLRINFLYGSGLPNDDIAPLHLHTNRQIFDKQSNSHFTLSDVSALKDDESVVSSLSYAELLALYDRLTDFQNIDRSLSSDDAQSNREISGFI